MLEQLVRYAETHGLKPEPGFEPRQVRWAAVFSKEGRFLNVVELGDTSQKRNSGVQFPKCPALSFSELRAGGTTPRSHVLVETADTVALLVKDNETEKDRARLVGKHAWFVDTMKLLAADVPELKAVAESLSDEAILSDLRDALVRQKAKPTDKVTVGIQGNAPLYPVESDAWHDTWRNFRLTLMPEKKSSGKKKAGKGKSKQMLCLVTGELEEPMSVHPKIGGLSDVGGLSMGDVLAGFKQDSFCSYGLKQARNAAVSEQAATAYATALNDLIKNHSERLAAAKVAHWYEASVPKEDDPLAWLAQPPERDEYAAQEAASKLLEAIRTGERPDLGNNHYYALTLSGNSGRVVVRDWMEGSFEDLVLQIDRWFEDLAIVHRRGAGPAPSPKFMAVLGATVRDLNDLAPPLVATMWRVALRGLPIPRQAMAQALARMRIDLVQDNPFNHARMGLLRAYHVRRGDTHMTPGLNEEHPSPVYHCGRLMAVLADLQRAALGDVGAGLVQRYYAAASTTPSLVLGRLLRTSQFHASKLEPKLARWFENRKAAIINMIGDTMPGVLKLDEQSLFALGYYHQMAAPRKAVEETGEAPATEEKSAQ